MRYSVQTGLQPNLADNFGEHARYVLGFLALLLLVIVMGLTGKNSFRGTHKPVTLGIYTIKTAQLSKPSSGNHKATASTSSSSGGSSPAATAATSTGGYGGYALPASTSPTYSAPTSSLTSSPTPASGTSSPTTTVSGGSTGTTSTQSGSVSTTLQSPSISAGSVGVGSTSLTLDPGLPKPSL